MLKKLASCVLASLLLHAAGVVSPAAARVSKDGQSAEKVKAGVAKRAGKKKRVTLKMQDGSKLRGYVTQAGEDSFTLTDAQSGQARSLNYRDVSQVKGPGMATWKKVAIVGVIAAVAAAGVIAYSITHSDVLGDGPIFR